MNKKLRAAVAIAALSACTLIWSVLPQWIAPIYREARPRVSNGELMAGLDLDEPQVVAAG
ncbi:MAG: hypothetical protein ACYDAY_02070 [Candidatus Dormibacteria bacterium]